MRKPFFLAARTAFDAYAPSLRLVSAGEVLPGITLVPLPGHTPGHSGYHIVSRGEQLLIWADITHLADVQIRKPEVTIGFDVRPRPGAYHPHEGARPGRDRPPGPSPACTLNMPGFLTVERQGSGYTKVDLPWTPALL